ncbi:hypothetical protein EDB89DRAFT_2070691 [Lactarius sanguifluus]|nr:hypothetical protein EDB89DRAFT_2070691 [Lactarius sanguifluus]
MAPEPALSSPAWLVTFAPIHCARDTLCWEQKDEGAGGGAQAQSGGKAVLFVLNNIDLVPLANALAHLKRLCTRTSTLPFLSARPPPVLESLLCYTHQCTTTFSGCLGRTSQLALSLLDVGKSSISGYYGDAHGKAYAMTAPLGHTRELERWFNRPKAANSAPQVCTRFSLRRTVRPTSGRFELKKDLGTFLLPDLKLHGAEMEHRRSVRPQALSVLLADLATDPFRAVPAVRRESRRRDDGV